MTVGDEERLVATKKRVDPGDQAVDRILQRRARRLTGKEYATSTASDGATAAHAEVTAGPELVTPTTPMPTTTERSASIKERILDIAEYLFARWSYTGVSIRDVTDLAGMRLGSVNYYFGSKQNLYFEVLRRRSEVLAAGRIAAIDAAIASQARGSQFVTALVDAYMMPAMSLSINGGEGWQNFFQLIGHITFSRLWPEQIRAYFNGPAERFVLALKSRFPDASEFQCQSVSILIIGPVIYILARTGRIETFSDPAFSSDDLDALAPETRRFVASGICGVLGIEYDREA